LFDLFVGHHHRDASPHDHIVAVTVVAVAINKVAFFERRVLKALNKLKHKFILEILVLEKVKFSKEFIDLEFVYLLKGDFHLACYQVYDTVYTILVMRVFLSVDRS